MWRRKMKPVSVGIKSVIDHRGVTNIAELESCIPFEVKRTFWVTGVPEGCERGGHAHHTTEEVVFCLQGQISVEFDDGTHKHYRVLFHPGEGLYLPPKVWRTLRYTSDAIALVMASEKYKPEDYIHSYEQFKGEVK
jgi:uncharacterized RmlC-like cupin family protein